MMIITAMMGKINSSLSSLFEWTLNQSHECPRMRHLLQIPQKQRSANCVFSGGK
jgi:hypothetical protein